MTLDPKEQQLIYSIVVDKAKHVQSVADQVAALAKKEGKEHSLQMHVLKDLRCINVKCDVEFAKKAASISGVERVENARITINSKGGIRPPRM